MKRDDKIDGKRISTSRSRTSVALSLLCAPLCWGLTAQAVPPPSGVAPLLTPTGGFAIDGDLLANKPNAGTGDWLPGPSGTGGAVLDANGAPLNPATTFHFVDLYDDANDETFGGGLKWTDDPNIWQWVTRQSLRQDRHQQRSAPRGHRCQTAIRGSSSRPTASAPAVSRTLTSSSCRIPLTRNSNGTLYVGRAQWRTHDERPGVEPGLHQRRQRAGFLRVPLDAERERRV